MQNSNLEILYQDLKEGVDICFWGSNMELQCEWKRLSPTGQCVLANSSTLIHTLNNQGCQTVFVDKAKNPKVTVKNLKYSPVSTYIALADEITVEGVGNIPWILRPQERVGADDFAEIVGDQSIAIGKEKLTIIFAGTPAECLNAIRSENIIISQVILNSYCVDDVPEEWKTEGYMNSSGSVNRQEVELTLIDHILRGFTNIDSSKLKTLRQVVDFKERINKTLDQVKELIQYTEAPSHFWAIANDAFSIPNQLIKAENDLKQVIATITDKESVIYQQYGITK